jgi:signal recognition particle GTPase
MQWIHWKILVTLKNSHLPGHREALQESNKYSQIVFIDCSVYDWLDSLIGLGGMLLALSHLFAVAVKFYGWGWKKVNN